MQSHNKRKEALKEFYDLEDNQVEEVIGLLDNYLPFGYSVKIVDKFFADYQNKVTKQVVRLVKSGKTKNSKVFKLLIEMATKNKKSEVADRSFIKKQLSV